MCIRDSITPATLAELPEILPERGLVLVVEDAHGRLGIVALCPALLASVIEMQSLGRVTRAPLRERRPTRTDASICADFVNAILSELATEFAGLGGDGIATYRHASFVEDPKPLDLMLDEVTYRAMRLDLRLGQGGLRDGAVLIFLPDAAAEIAPPPARAAGAPQTAPAAQGRDLSQAMRGVPVAVNLVLCRRQISLRELRALQTDSVLKLPAEAMSMVRLETEQGQLLAQGKLGALNGNRAIRIGGASGGRKAPPVPVAAAEMLPEGAGNVFGEGLAAEDADAEVAADAVDTAAPESLAFTGSDLGLAGAGVALLAAGGAAAMIARRRQRGADDTARA